MSAPRPRPTPSPRHRSREAEVAAGLETARRRTLALTDADDTELVRQHSPLMSPLVWDLAHIGQQEDLWLLRHGDAGAQGLLAANVERLYDAFEHPRAERVTLPLLTPQESRAFVADVRSRVLDDLDRLEGRGDAEDADAVVVARPTAPGLAPAPAGQHRLFAHVMVEQHEQQHVETMLATHQLRDGAPILGPGTPLPPGRPLPSGATREGSVPVPGGPFVLGVDGADEPWSLDNERPAHVVDLPAFRIGRVPVTNADWQAFVDAGGYDEPRWWSPRGWAHKVEAGLTGPLFWTGAGSRRRFGHVEALVPDEPVQHVDFFEAEAFARFAGGRLPTEQEWEKACAWDPVAGHRRRWPWGAAEVSPSLANLGGEALRPARVGAYPAGASAYGVEQLVGDVWEWTSSGFEPWPGFVPMVYAQYSAPFFGGDFRVLRGGSWAVGGASIRPSFRNWDLPVRRQIFTGLRLAWDVDPGEGV